MARRRGSRVAAAVAAVVVVAGGGYAVADAYDVVPGVVTLEPLPEPPRPFPTAPGAVAPEDVTALVPYVDPATPLPDPEELRDRAVAAAGHRWMGDSVGIVVADQMTGQVLVDLDGDRAQVPASTAKLITAAAALSALGPDATLDTTVVQAGSRIVLVGAGDMMLAAGAGDPSATNGRAGLADLADQVARELRLSGTTEVSLTVDDSLFSGPALAPGWQPSHMNLGYVAPVASVAVNIAKTRDEPYPPRHSDPAVHAGQVLAQALADRGVTVSGGVARGAAPEGARPVGSVSSATVREIARYVLHTSDNTLAEVLGRLVAVDRGLPGSFQGATTAILAEVDGLGLDTTGARLADCSGLADGSLLSASLLADLMLHVTTPENAALLAVAVDNPVAGWHGTLADRLTGPPAAGMVRAKTGSLPGVTSLAGTVVTSEGRPLVFAIVTDQTPPGGQLGPRRVIDTFVQQLAGCDCELP